MGLHVGCLLLVLAVALLKVAAADNYAVGDDLGWTIPPAGSIAYKTWANKKRFQIGDTIVAEVSEANYGNCTKSNPLALYDSSPVTIALTSNLTRYFICPEGKSLQWFGTEGDYQNWRR